MASELCGMRSRLLAIALLALFVASVSAPVAVSGQGKPAAKSARTVYYEPERVELTGTVKRHVFPGPPNYTDVKKGDAAEPAWVLHSPQPVKVVPKAGKPGETDEMNTPETASDFQLVLDSDQLKKYRALLGKKVTATGTLFHAHTGHHHTAVLMSVTALKEAK